MSSGISTIFEKLKEITSGIEVERFPNPFYPEESYEEYVSRLIVEKKKVIERFLGIR